MNKLLIFIGISIFVIVILTTWYFKKSFRFWKDHNVPYPQPSFPLGNVSLNFSKYYGQVVAKIYQTMKSLGHSFCGFYIITIPIFLPIDLKLVKNILTVDNKYFYDRGIYVDEINDPMGYSILTACGNKWKEMRNSTSPAFTNGKIKNMFPIVLKCVEDLDKAIQDDLRNDQLLNISDLARRFTIESISWVLFGIKANCLQSSNYYQFNYSNMITQINDDIRLALGFILPNFSKLFKINFLNPKDTNFFRNVIKEVIDYRKRNNIEVNDLLNILINQETGNNNKIDDSRIIDKIASQCLGFFLAGFETSSYLIKYSLYEIAKNQDIQEKLRNEIIETVNENSEITYDNIKKMRYLDNIINETLRKYPPVITLNRICTKNYKNSNITIKKGTKVIISILGVHNDSEYYPNPEKFDPNRFCNEERAKRPSFVFFPFGYGPRICPGLFLGLMETKICLAYLIPKYKFLYNNPIFLRSKGNTLITESPIFVKAKII